MKTFITAIFLITFVPLNAENIGDRSNRQAYESQRGYAFEQKCFRYEYREEYVPGTSSSPGYVRSYNEKIAVPCNGSNIASENYNYPTNQTMLYSSDQSSQNCSGNRILGAIVGGGIAASLSETDAYGWTIPLGVVLGMEIADSECN